MKAPPFVKTLIVSDNPEAAAELSSILALRGHYLPVLEGPREVVPDPVAELVRRNNTIARAKPEEVMIVGLDEKVAESLKARMAPRLRDRASIMLCPDIEHVVGDRQFEVLQWGRDRMGVGLLKALRSGRRIVFTDDPSPQDNDFSSIGGHLVVCEQGEPMSEVIAANYAYALGAGLCLLPPIDRNTSEDLLERFYSAYDDPDMRFRECIRELRSELRGHLKDVVVPEGGSITFVTGGLPYGFADPDHPSTHLFKYPDLGAQIIHGFAAEQADRPGINCVALIDPGTTRAPEIEAAGRILPPRGGMVRVYEGGAADVRSVSNIMDWFPYDLMVIATHCGDADGWRWTYEFTDSEGNDRVFVVDIAIGVGRAGVDGKLPVTQYMRFVSLDGVDWNDPAKSEKLHVGSAIHDFMRFTLNDELEPVSKVRIPRVVGSSALKMADNNLIVLPKPLADEGTPIIINNACSSWHRLAGNMIYGNARAYLGTLHPVQPVEAEVVITKLMERHFDKPLPAALWAAQRDAYRQDAERRPYVMAGVYPQRLRMNRKDVIERLLSRLGGALKSWRAFQQTTPTSDADRRRRVDEAVAFYEREVAHFSKLAEQR